MALMICLVETPITKFQIVWFLLIMLQRNQLNHHHNHQGLVSHMIVLKNINTIFTKEGALTMVLARLFQYVHKPQEDFFKKITEPDILNIAVLHNARERAIIFTRCEDMKARLSAKRVKKVDQALKSLHKETEI